MRKPNEAILSVKFRAFSTVFFILLVVLFFSTHFLLGVFIWGVLGLLFWLSCPYSVGLWKFVVGPLCCASNRVLQWLIREG